MLSRCLLNTSHHSGVEGFVIQNIKNQIDETFKVRVQTQVRGQLLIYSHVAYISIDLPTAFFCL